jgi:hypothetical protein
MAELNARVPVTSELRDELRALKTDENQRYEDVLWALVREHKDNA